MRLNLASRRRVEAVEKRRRYRKPLPTIITGIYPEECRAVVGIEGDNGQRVHLRAGKTPLNLQARAVATFAGRMFRTCYRVMPER